MTFPTTRPRRLRRTPLLRNLVQEHRLHPDQLILPLFVREDIDTPVPLTLLQGHVQHSVASVVDAVGHAIEVGCHSILLFGLPAHKDDEGSEAWNPQGIMQRAIAAVRAAHGNAVTITADCCLDEYTGHGHCGVLNAAGDVDNDLTIGLYGKIAVSQATAGADIIAPSGMMDGQVQEIRRALDAAGFPAVAIMAYSAKYASVLYGPFREAADCAPKEGNRKGYQMDPANSREALVEALLDLEEGADILMVKPGLLYGDVIAKVRASTNTPIAAYCVSGEYAMVHAAAAMGAFDLSSAVLEAHLGLLRAGADIIITYDALEICQSLTTPISAS